MMTAKLFLLMIVVFLIGLFLQLILSGCTPRY